MQFEDDVYSHTLLRILREVNLVTKLSGVFVHFLSKSASIREVPFVVLEYEKLSER